MPMALIDEHTACLSIQPPVLVGVGVVVELLLVGVGVVVELLSMTVILRTVLEVPSPMRVPATTCTEYSLSGTSSFAIRFPKLHV